MLDVITAAALSFLVFVSPAAGDAVLVQNSLSLTNRQPNPTVNEVFADNIILNLRYASDPNFKRPASKQDWVKVREPFEVSFKLASGEVFAFQQDAMPEFKENVVKTTNAKFNYEQGFRSSGYLMGDGVCHLASFINMTAKQAGLEIIAPINHNFAVIPDIPREYGTSIFYSPGNTAGNARQNLYITNNFDEEITFTFTVVPEKVTLAISK